MKKMITSTLALILIGGTAHSEIVQWKSNSKKFTYAIAGIGAVVSLGGKYTQSLHKEPLTRRLLGGATVTLAAQILYVQISSEVTTANRALMHAEHRGLVHYAEKIQSNEVRSLNSNFDELLAEFECDLDDSEKAVVFAKLIKKADELGAAAQAKGDLSEEVESQVQAELEQSLGPFNTIRNQILIKYIIAQSFLNKAQQAGK